MTHDPLCPAGEKHEPISDMLRDRLTCLCDVINAIEDRVASKCWKHEQEARAEEREQAAKRIVEGMNKWRGHDLQTCDDYDHSCPQIRIAIDLVRNEQTFTHDPFCYWTDHEGWDGGSFCDECERIGKARAEERERAWVRP